ncbi:MAG: acyl-CoA dehydrogenase [Betaproteobacteria bacterium]|nr:acyl-CoA dehydrogenase [Betaproteobacteria bacterium]
MTSRLINRRDLDFLLYEWLGAGALTVRDRFAEHGRQTFDAAIESAHRLAEEHFASHNRKADEHEPRLDGKFVSMIPEVKAALEAFSASGFTAAAHDYELGGMQLPFTVTQACFALFQSANVGSASYVLLSMANANLLRAFGSREHQRLYLRPLLDGRYFGTMALTEPQAGSSLSDLRSTAVPAPDGHYLLTGNKIFISGGDHELCENIIHLVLARVRGAPAGAKGISLFIVPKFLVNPDGSRGARNDVVLSGLIHKMGWRGTTSTMLNFGENGRCVAYLLGEPHQGLRYMFHMMNEARVGVGLSAVMLAYTAYLHSLAYARARPQGRLPGAKNPEQAQVPIIEHADVRRMLLAQKAYAEGGLALCLYCARLVDDKDTAPGEHERQEAHLLLEILTPIAKSWPSQWSQESISLAIQVHGGYGYTREYPVEQFYRDNRLNAIHEGTHGIHGLDLLGRKVVMQDGAALQLLMREMDRTIREAKKCNSPELVRAATALADAITLLLETTRNLLCASDRGESGLALANASVYLEMTGHIVMAWIWLRQALVALERLPSAPETDRAFYQGKLQACGFFFRWELPKIKHQNQLLNDMDRTCLEMQDEWF